MSTYSLPMYSSVVLTSPTFRLRVAQINPHRAHIIDIAPDAAMRAALVAEFGLISLPALRLHGQLRASGAQDWVFEGRMQADVVQPCVTTLAPVATHIDETLRRHWRADLDAPNTVEAEMGDENIDPLGAVIDMGAVLEEAFALALPPYPRADGAEPAPEGAQVAADTSGGPADQASAADPDDEAGRRETRKPFADLASLLARKHGK